MRIIIFTGYNFTR